MQFTRRNFLKTTTATVGALTVTSSFPALAETVKKAAANNGPIPPEHLILNRTTFGPRMEDREAFHRLASSQGKRIQKYIEQQCYPEHINDAAFEKRLAALDLVTLTKTQDQIWKDHVIAADELKEQRKEEKKDEKKDPAEAKKSWKEKKRNENQLRMQPAEEVEMATWMKAVYSERQLNEVLADFWHNHFNVFAWDQKTAPLFVNYDREVIRKHMWGNFREMLEAVATSPAMLFYLDNTLNQSGNPNENYARELFELHTLGAENYLGTMERTKVSGYGKAQPIGYVDGDVYEAARAFTGWRVDQGKNVPNTGHFEYFDQWHDRFQKVILGKHYKEYQPPLKDGRDVLDNLAKHPGTARYLARKLCRRFVSDNPGNALVEKIAKAFRDMDKEKDQLRQVVYQLLTSEEFLTQSEPKMKRPFEYVASALRVLQADFFAGEDFLRNYERTGQRLFGCRTPDGYPDQRDKWCSSASLIERWRLVNQICSDKREDLFVSSLEVSGKIPHSDQLLDQWVAKTLPPQANLAGKKKILDFLQSQPNENHLRMAVALVINTPENQWR